MPLDADNAIELVANTAEALRKPKKAYRKILKVHKRKQLRHWQVIEETEFADSTLRQKSKARGGRKPQPGEFATGSGLLRDQLANGHDFDDITLFVGPLQGRIPQHTYDSAPLEEVLEKQEQIQQERHNRSLLYEIDDGTAKGYERIMLDHWTQGWEKA